MTNNARYTIIKDLKDKKYITVQITLKDMFNIEYYLIKKFVEEILANGKSEVDNVLTLSEIYEAV